MNKSRILRFQGYTKTPTLFQKDNFAEFECIELNSVDNLVDEINFKNKRLGKLVEEFVFYQLKKQNSVNWICQNLQIQKEKQTIGELDALYALNEQPIHLEIVYKFYLYDTLNSYEDPLSYWIGPNRKDSLIYKLEKLKKKQFPLLYKTETQKQLAQFKFDINLIQQQLCFKAQLFLPYNHSKINTAPLNENCVHGFFISYKDLTVFEDLQFYIPKKLDWLVIPHNDVIWINFEEAKKIIQKEIENDYSPMVWLKYNNIQFKKCFITWW